MDSRALVPTRSKCEADFRPIELLNTRLPLLFKRTILNFYTGVIIVKNNICLVFFVNIMTISLIYGLKGFLKTFRLASVRTTEDN